MRFWLLGTAAWLAYFAWLWADCSIMAPGLSFDIGCPASAPVYTFSWGGFAAFLAETALLPPTVILLTFVVIRWIMRRT
jgi:hypothetical protein